MSLDTLLTTLASPDAPPRTTDLTLLSAIGGAERERFLDVWRTLSIQRRRDLVDRLTVLAEDNVELDFSPVFLVGLFDDDVQVRAQSVRGLWEYEGLDLVPLLTRLLRDPEAIVRAEALEGLGRFLLEMELEGRDEDAAERIARELRGVYQDESQLADVRGRALEALGVYGAAWVDEAIEGAYASGDRRLRISAVAAMGRSAEPKWLPQVLREMGSDDPEMRFEAATAAGAIGDEDAIDHLAVLTSDDDAEVQEAAIAALGEIGGPRARSILQSVASESKDERVLEAVSDALAAADFLEDPLAFKLYLDRSVAEDADEDDDNA